MPQEHPTSCSCDLGQLRTPAIDPLDVVEDLANQLVEHQVDQLLLVLYVPVQRGCPGPELPTEPAHRERLEPFGIDQADRNSDDLIAGQRLALAAGRRIRSPGEG